MTIFQYFHVFRTLSVDVLALALAVTLLTALCKRTVMKNCPKKVFVFLPFVIGVVLYAVYRAIVTMSAAPFTTELAITVERGLSTGLTATLYYVIYEQFFRAGKLTVTKQDRIMPFFEGIVPEEKRTTAADELVKRSEGATGDELNAIVREVLNAYADPALTEVETEATVYLIVKSLTGFV